MILPERLLFPKAVFQNDFGVVIWRHIQQYHETSQSKSICVFATSYMRPKFVDIGFGRFPQRRLVQTDGLLQAERLLSPKAVIQSLKSQGNPKAANGQKPTSESAALKLDFRLRLIQKTNLLT